MIGKLIGKEQVSAALSVALAGAIAVLAAKGNGRLSLGRVASGALSNPVPRTAPVSEQSHAADDLGLAA